MNINDLKPASDFVKHFGAKCLVYGPAGSAKTPTINTAPRPLLLAVEPGMLSMRGSSVPTFEAFTVDKIEEFFKWFKGSNEIKNFDTIGIDSGSQIAETYLIAALKSNKHGKAAYGEMATKTMEHMRTIYFTQYKHAYVIAKECNVDGLKRCYFPGQQLLTDAPHLFDFVLRLATVPVPGQGETRAFQCNNTYDVAARNRTGNLNDFEEPNFAKLVQKALS